MEYPVIDIVATGKRINEIRIEKMISVKAIAEYMGFNNMNSVYKWFRGDALPSLDNIYALSSLFNVNINDMIVTVNHIEKAS